MAHPQDIRTDYTVGQLNEVDAGDDPVALFARWFDDARRRLPDQANMMALATVDSSGRPDARIVLLKGFGNGDFHFFTNFTSGKGTQLETHPHAALVLHWAELERQVRIRGPVEKLPHEQAEAYFHSRPLGSQFSAAASAQSQPVPDRATLEQRVAELKEAQPNHVPMPDTWGGYRVRAESIEFWQGRADRLHDRLRYTRKDSVWQRERLQP